MSGLDFLRSLPTKPHIVITTAYREYAVESFDLDVLDYLVKPIPFGRFLKAINKAEKRSNKAPNTRVQDNTETLFLNVDKTHHKIVVSDILFIESNRNYITVVTKTQKLSYIESLKNWKEKLPTTDFIQIHKSFIINKNDVDKIAGNEIYVSGNRLPIGRTYKQELLSKLKIG